MEEALLDYRFFKAMEDSGSTGSDAGWMPVFFTDKTGTAILYSFVKSHSYGEYIFDWQWANAFQEHGIAYYPKLTSMIPLSPITTSHFIMREFNVDVAHELMDQYEEFYQKYNFSSSHFLFTTPAEVSFFESRGYQTRESFQYHFTNEGYQKFEDFLGTLKTKKAKNLRSERIFPELVIKQFTGTDLTPELAQEMYQFYLSTIDLKNSMAYLKEDFFKIIFETMKGHVMYVRALLDDKAIAGALFFYDSKRLYGRYWGSDRDYPNLHFELCYYQGIDFCIERKIPLFEAGAQGEHKITRGFRPVRTFSAHKIKHPSFDQAISQFIRGEKTHVAAAITELSHRLPFK
jgi:predicted N-acyltransferase